MFIKDRAGVVELPFKLIIASIIVIITTSMAFAGLDSYSESSMRDKVEAAVEEFTAAAGDVSTMGVNSSVKVGLDLKSSMFHRVESFIIGCSPDEDHFKCKGVEYKMAGYKAKWTAVKDHAGHDIVLKGKDGRVTLREGSHKVLLMKCPDHLEVFEVD